MSAGIPSRVRSRRSPLLPAVVAACITATIAPTPGPAFPGESPTARRPVPDYDGRPDPAPGAGEALLWVPRALLAPLHVLMEHGVRRPVRTVAGQTEKNRLIPLARHLLTWDHGRATLLPTLFYEFGLNPNVGFLFFWKDLGVPGHRIEARGGFWVNGWHQVSVKDEWVSSDRRLRWTFRGGWSRRPDHAFHGIGPDTSGAGESEFGMGLGHVAVETVVRLAGMSTLGLELAYRDASFGRGDEDSIETRHDVRRIPGFEGYRLLGGTLRLVLDTRQVNRWGTSGTGARLETEATLGVAPARRGARFARWSVEGAGFWDLTGYGHVLGARLYLGIAEPLGRRPVPFTELPQLGGLERMAGYLEGRFRGPSVLDATVEYRYPIWAYLDGTVFVGAGNAFGPDLARFHPKRLFLNWGIGLRSSNRRTVSIEVLLAWGTTRLDADRFGIEKVHFVIGLNRGF